MRPRVVATGLVSNLKLQLAYSIAGREGSRAVGFNDGLALWDVDAWPALFVNESVLDRLLLPSELQTAGVCSMVTEESRLPEISVVGCIPCDALCGGGGAIRGIGCAICGVDGTRDSPLTAMAELPTH